MTLPQVQNSTPNENGIIFIEGRRFVKEILLSWIRRNEGEAILETVNMPEVKKQRIPKPVRPPAAIPGTGAWKRRAVIATLPDGKELSFPSIRLAAYELKINHSNIPKVCTGKHKTVCGMKFRYAS